MASAIGNQAEIIPSPATVELPTEKQNSTKLTEVFGCPEVIHENDCTIWTDFGTFCQKVNRPATRVCDFFRKELTPPELTRKIFFDFSEVRRLIIRFMLEPARIEEILQCYIDDYVTCNTCNGLETELTVKDKDTYSIKCMKCHSQRTAPSIPSGYLIRIPKEAACPNRDRSNKLKGTAGYSAPRPITHRLTTLPY